MKKLEDAPAERNCERTKTQRQDFTTWLLQNAQRFNFIYIDEAGINLWTKRTLDRARRGDRAVRVVQGRRGPNLTMTLMCCQRDQWTRPLSIASGWNDHYKYLGQTTYLKETTKEEIKCRIRTGWSCFGRNREVFLDEKLPMSLRRQVFDQCVLPSMTYGCQTWSLSKAMGQKLRTAQRAMERKMLNLKIKDKVPYTEIRKRTRVQDIVQFVLKQKWKWAGHVARLDDNRWTQRVTEWQLREGRRSRGRQRKRWRDDLVQLKGVTWRHDAQHRQRWRSDVEGYFQQWRNTAS